MFLWPGQKSLSWAISHNRYSLIFQYFIFPHIQCRGGGPRLPRPGYPAPAEIFRPRPRVGLAPAKFFTPRPRRGLRPGWLFRPRRGRCLPGPEPGPRQTLELSLHLSHHWLRHFFLVNRVEHQKLEQTTRQQSCRLAEFFVFNSAFRKHRIFGAGGLSKMGNVLFYDFLLRLIR